MIRIFFKFALRYIVIELTKLLEIIKYANLFVLTQLGQLK